MADASLCLSVVRLGTLNAVGSTAREISESQDRVLLPVSVCASGHLKSLFVNKYIQWWKENKSSYIFFTWLWVPWEVIQKFYYQYRQWWGSFHQPFEMPSINHDRAICWREGAVQAEQVFLLPGGLRLETSKHFFLGSGGTISRK